MTDQYDETDSEIIHIVAHDLKGPVSAVRGFIELTEHSGPLNERQQHFLARAQAALSRMERLISSLLDFAQLESGLTLEYVHVDLCALIDEALDLLTDMAAQRDISIHVPSSVERIMVPADERLLGHVMNNLLSNAIKFTADGGNVWVRVAPQRTQIRVDVQDDGVGIDPKDHARVFERFYRASHKGLRTEGNGLGLAICKAIIQMHNGNIWVQSAVGMGSKFSFTLPLHRAAGEQGRNLGSLEEETASEVHDPVDDNMQEWAEAPEADSKYDTPD